MSLLAFAGCGGSSDSDSVTTSSAESTTPADTSGTGAEKVTNSPQAGGPDAANGPAGKSSGEKHGPRIVQPKGPPEPHITAKQRSEATVANMVLRSPVSVPGEGRLETLPARYTCDGKNVSPALTWKGVPDGTQELALFAMNVQPVEGKLFFDWAVTGIDPELGEIEAEKLPHGAVVGRNSFGKNGYGLCPEEGGEIYMFALYALPNKLSPQHGFDPHELRQQALDASGSVGLLPLTYVRG